MKKNQQAEEVYQQIKERLKGQEGKIIAIDLDSGDFFLGKNAVEAFRKGRKKHPNKEFFFKRVGTKAAYHVG